MKNIKTVQKNKTEFTFGELVEATYQTGGARRAANLVQLLIKARWVIFHHKQEAKFFDFLRERKSRLNHANASAGRMSVGTGTVLLAGLLGLAGFANSSHAQVVVVRPPEIVVPTPGIVVGIPGPDIGFGMPAPGFLYGGDYDGRREARDYGRRGRESRGAAHGDRGGGHPGKR